MDTSARGLTAGDAVRVVVVDATEVSQQTAEVHGLGVGAAQLAGELNVAALLMGGHIKGEERITLQVQTLAPQSSAFAEVCALGTLRGRVQPPDLDPREDHTGVLLAIKANDVKELYRGATELRKESLQSALSQHLISSAQVQGAVVIDVRVNDEGIERAAGMLLERLPVDPDRPSMSPEEFAERFSDLTVADLDDALKGTLRGETLRVLDQLPLMWMCRCSREKVSGMLRTIGPAGLAQMRAEDHGAEVTCHFCGDVYQFDEDDLSALIAESDVPAEA